MQKIKKFLAEYELLTIPIFLLLAVFSFAIIEFVFKPDSAINSPPNYETYHYFFRTCLIYVIVLALKWRWYKSDSPRSAEVMKEGWRRAQITGVEQSPQDHNKELIYAYLKWFAYLFLFAATAHYVFP